MLPIPENNCADLHVFFAQFSTRSLLCVRGRCRLDRLGRCRRHGDISVGAHERGCCRIAAGSRPFPCRRGCTLPRHSPTVITAARGNTASGSWRRPPAGVRAVVEIGSLDYRISNTAILAAIPRSECSLGDAVIPWFSSNRAHPPWPTTRSVAKIEVEVARPCTREAMLTVWPK